MKSRKRNPALIDNSSLIRLYQCIYPFKFWTLVQFMHRTEIFPLQNQDVSLWKWKILHKKEKQTCWYLKAVMAATLTRALHRDPLLELFWTDNRLSFQWPQKKSISAGALSCSSAPRRVLSRTSSESVHSFRCWSLENIHHGTERLAICSGTSRGNSQFIPDVLVVRTNNNKKKKAFEPPSLPLCTALILIPVDTCYFFDAKYKETSDGSLIREHTFKAVFTQRSVSGCLAVWLRGAKHGLLQQGYCGVWRWCSHASALGSWNYQKRIRF